MHRDGKRNAPGAATPEALKIIGPSYEASISLTMPTEAPERKPPALDPEAFVWLSRDPKFGGRVAHAVAPGGLGAVELRLNRSRAKRFGHRGHVYRQAMCNHVMLETTGRGPLYEVRPEVRRCRVCERRIAEPRLCVGWAFGDVREAPEIVAAALQAMRAGGPS